ncbi:two-component system histidine kinase PnpS [Virgibacillus halophilus]
MKYLFSTALWKYTIGIILLIVVSGAVLLTVIEDYIILMCVLLFQGIMLFLMLLFAFDKFIKPLHQAVRTVEELVKGNYRARIYHRFDGEIGELSKKVNALAKNLSELSIQEQMQSEQLASVINHTHSALLFIDERGYIQLINQEFLSVFKISEEDCQGYLYYEAIANEQVHEMVRNIFLYEKTIKSNLTLRQSVVDRFMEMTGVPIFNERGMLRGAVLAFYDITELKKLEMMRKDFVANVSHELKTPVTSIKGFSETLLEENMDEQTRENFLQIIYDESSRLQALINDLLTLSSLEKEYPTVKLQKFDFELIIAEIKPGFEMLARDRHLTFYIEMSGNVYIMADSNQMKQVLINLLTNAFNYTPEGGSVTLRIYETETEAIIQVEDTGMGMEQDMIQRIFERFFRLDEARSRDTGGTGLGLAIVKHIVENHKGHIDVQSEPGGGTTFTVSIPHEGL